MNLLERDQQLDALDGWLREAAAGEGRLVFAGGEAGVGKTSLSNCFCELNRGRARVLLGVCDPLSTPRPLGPLQDIASMAGGELDRLLQEGAPRDRVFRTALTELGAGTIPTIAVVEDAHWADEATLDLLRFLGRRLESAPLLLLVTYRDDEVGAKHPLRLVIGDLATTRAIRRLALDPLSRAGIHKLAAGSELDPDELYRLTGGNPFFASEVLADRTAATGGIPATVRDTVLARASRLPAAGREALDAAAVIGPAIETALLSEMASASTESIEACLAAGILVPVPGHANDLAFRHELARVAIYDAISPSRRSALHGRVLDALQSGPDPRRDLARLAHHAEAAGEWASVLCFAPAAAHEAATVRAHREAAAQYERALRFAGVLPADDRARLHEAHAYECYLTDRHEAAIASRQAAIQLWEGEENDAKVGENLRWISRHTWFVGSHNEAERLAHEAIAILAATNSRRQLAWAYSNLAQLRMLADDHVDTVLWGERALALAEECGEQEVVVHALNNLGAAIEMAGDARGREYLERSLELAQEHGYEEHIARGFTNLTAGAFSNRELAVADRYVNEGLAYATEHDLNLWRPFLLAARSEIRFFRGDWAGAADDSASVCARPNVSPITLMSAQSCLGRIRVRRGDPESTSVMNEALALAEQFGKIQSLVPIRLARAEAADLAGDGDRIAAEIRALDDYLGPGTPESVRGELSYWLWRAGEFVGDPAAVQGPFGLEIAGQWRAAADAWEALGCPYEVARALAEGDDEDALRSALATFERLGARPMATITARRLRDLGARAIPRGPRSSTRANPASLTARELEIVPLLAAGWRNAEIADRLFLSPKTVERHVGSILAKLGVRSRGEVAGSVARLGIVLDVPERGEAT